nr:hypothetical protein [Kosakonia pseudosacchari]
MLITLPQVDNALFFWLPPDNPYRDSVVVSESAVDFAHSCFAFR